MKKLLLFLIVISLLRPLSSFAISPVDLSVSCIEGSCTVSGSSPLFSTTLDGYWYPGRSLSKSFQITNNSPSSQQTGLRSTRTSADSILEAVMTISILDASANVIYSGSLSDFYQHGQINLATLPAAASANFTFTAGMASSAGNEYQNLDTVFNLNLGFISQEAEPTLTPTPTNSPTGGGGAGGNPGAPVCDKPAPPAPEIYTVEDPTTTTPLIRWYNITAPFTHYLIAYGPNRDTILYGNPNIGTDNKYHVGGLTAGAQYCFYVRAVNDCMPGPASNIRCINVGSTIATTPIAGFQSGVLGAQTTENQPSVGGVTAGQVEAASTTNQCSRFWLPLLYLLALLINFFYLRRRRSLAIPLLVSVLAFLIDRIFLNYSCCLGPSWYCQYFWIGNILATIIPLTIYRRPQSL